MTTVRGYLQMFQMKSIFSDYREQLGTMIEELDRANSIITEFLSLAKNKKIELTLGNLNVQLMCYSPYYKLSAFCSGHKFKLISVIFLRFFMMIKKYGNSYLTWYGTVWKL